MTADLLSLIERAPDVAHGQAVVRGTRVPVSVILDCVAAGMSVDDVVDEYPSVTAEGVRAAAAYGAMLARDLPCPVDPAE
jgi:uncharacterized protein (DUF433 family)